MKRFVALAVVTHCCICVNADAITIPQQIFFDRSVFEQQNPGLMLHDFEDIAPIGGSVQPPPPLSGVSFLGGSNSGIREGIVAVADRDNTEWGSPGFTTPTDVLFVNSLTGRLLIANFDEPATAVGLLVNVGFDEGPVVRVLAFSDAVELVSTEFPTSNAFDGFVGFSNVGPISRIEVQSLGGRGDFVLIDDLSFGVPVPEPNSLMILSGLLALLCVCCRKQTSHC